MEWLWEKDTASCQSSRFVDAIETPWFQNRDKHITPQRFLAVLMSFFCQISRRAPRYGPVSLETVTAENTRTRHARPPVATPPEPRCQILLFFTLMTHWPVAGLIKSRAKEDTGRTRCLSTTAAWMQWFAFRRHG